MFRPRKSDLERQDYSSPYQEVKSAVLSKLVAPVMQSDMFTGPAPESVQLLLQNFCNRSIGIVGDALSEVFLGMHSPQQSRYSFCDVPDLLNVLGNQNSVDFQTLIEQLQQLVPNSCYVAGDPAVQRAAERLKLMEMWSGGEFVRCKGKWLTVKCRTALERVKRDLSKLTSSVHNYEFVHKQKVMNTIVVSAWHLQLSNGSRVLSDIKDFVDAMNSTMTEGIPTVVLIGFKTVTVSVRPRIWANLVIVSPKVCMNSIDLSAADQASPLHHYALSLVKMVFTVHLVDPVGTWLLSVMKLMLLECSNTC